MAAPEWGWRGLRKARPLYEGRSANVNQPALASQVWFILHHGTNLNSSFNQYDDVVQIAPTYLVQSAPQKMRFAPH
jgi:hypothetical protein